MSCSGRGRASHGASPLNSVFGGHRGSCLSDDLDTAPPPLAGQPKAVEAVLLTMWRGLMAVLSGAAAIALLAFVCVAVLSCSFHGLAGGVVLVGSLVGSAALVMSHIWLLAALTCLGSSQYLARPFIALAACVVVGDIFVLPEVWRAVAG
jgi:hypothetical protein